MIYSSKFKVVLDANVLYPAPVRDLLLNLADLEIVTPYWSKVIQEEWVRNLLLNRPDLTLVKLKRTVKIMNLAFPGADVIEFEDLIDELELPDSNDRHVLAVAIKCKAKAIITFNKKDFPKKYVNQYNIEVFTPGKLIELMYKLNSELVNKAFENQLASLKNPPMSKSELINILEKCNVKIAGKIFK